MVPLAGGFLPDPLDVLDLFPLFNVLNLIANSIENSYKKELQDTDQQNKK